MRQAFTVAGRGSWLSLAQITIFKEKVKTLYPNIHIATLIEQTAGDKEQTTPLHLVEGSNFFTKEIQDTIENGQADFAVHSMKDVSNELFFNTNQYAIIDRDSLHDIVCFNSSILDKIENNQPIVIGTSSPRRSAMAIEFLKKALPNTSGKLLNITAEPIRGNVDTRLKKLDNKEYDGIVLAIAGLNRLLVYEPSKAVVASLLANKLTMLLPLFECPPAAGQGAIVVEAKNNNADAVTILNAIKNHQLANAIVQERKYATKYGYGCSQAFGVFHVHNFNKPFTYTAGQSQNNEPFCEWDYELPKIEEKQSVFATTDFMSDFFGYVNIENETINIAVNAVFIASHKAIHSYELVTAVKQKKVFAAGTKTWYHLAKKGIWVHGCADGLGYQYLLTTLTKPVYNIAATQIEIITNTNSAELWQANGQKAVATYTLKPTNNTTIIAKLQNATTIFWSSYQQYLHYKIYLKQVITHLCPAGRTANLLQQEGLNPIVFPTIKAFNTWRANNPNTITSEG
jgi:hydroxymethylbilane synthase